MQTLRFPKSLGRLLLPLFAVPLLAACNSAGTCMVPARGDSSLGDMCVLNSNKKDCEARVGEFKAEAAAAGLLRCKGEGYESPPGVPAGDVSKRLQEGKPHELYRKAK